MLQDSTAFRRAQVVFEILVDAASADQELVVRQVHRLPRHLLLSVLLEPDGHFQSRDGRSCGACDARHVRATFSVRLGPVTIVPGRRDC